MARIFISYSSADKADAAELHSWITQQGHEAFFDQHVDEGLVGGENWHARHQRLGR
jgi:hypothetical protein